MRAVLTNITSLCSLAIAVTIISAIASAASHEWTWFGRSGAIVTMCGMLLSVRRLIRYGPDEMARSESAICGGRYGDAEYEQVALVEARQRLRDHRATMIGVYLLLWGSIVWGYGDLVGRLQ